MRTADQLHVHYESLISRLKAPLLASPGTKFFAHKIASITKVPNLTVAAALNSYVNRGANNHGIQRDRAGPEGGYRHRFWIGEPRANDADVVLSFLKKNKRAITVFSLAMKLDMPIKSASDRLEKLHQSGQVVRCERPLYADADRFEYRITGVA